MRKYMLIHHAYLEDNTTTPCEIKIKNTNIYWVFLQQYITRRRNSL